MNCICMRCPLQLLNQGTGRVSGRRSIFSGWSTSNTSIHLLKY